jgi:hypothetical protein
MVPCHRDLQLFWEEGTQPGVADYDIGSRNDHPETQPNRDEWGLGRLWLKRSLGKLTSPRTGLGSSPRGPLAGYDLNWVVVDISLGHLRLG